MGDWLWLAPLLFRLVVMVEGAPEVSCSTSLMMVVMVWVSGCLWSKAGCEHSLGCVIVRVVLGLRTQWAPNVGIND
jgi:hypothetical protein